MFVAQGHDKQRLMIAASRLGKRWPRMSGPERRAFIVRAVTRVTVGEKEIRIVLRRDAPRQALLQKGLAIDSAVAPKR